MSGVSSQNFIRKQGGAKEAPTTRNLQRERNKVIPANKILIECKKNAIDLLSGLLTVVRLKPLTNIHF